MICMLLLGPQATSYRLRTFKKWGKAQNYLRTTSHMDKLNVQHKDSLVGQENVLAKTDRAILPDHHFRLHHAWWRRRGHPLYLTN